MTGPAFRTAAALACAAAVGALAPGATPAGAQPSLLRVRSGVTVAPDTVTVGDPFVVQVRVAAPPGAAVEFPAGPDSAGPVALLDPKRERPAAAPDGGVDVTATYRAAAWDVGDLALGLGDVVVRAGGAERRVSLAGARVVVRSVLPADSSRRTPKPVREPVPDPGLWWLRYALAALVAAALVAALLWWARRRWRDRRRPVAADAAYGEAVAAFARLDRLRLIEAGEGGRHVALSADVVRDYLAARRPAADRALTSGELLTALAADAHVPGDRLAGFLGVADVVKFAAHDLTAADAAAAAQEARRVVDDTEAAVRASAAQEAAAAAEQERVDREARRRYEEERRRAARRERGTGAGSDGGAPADRERAA